MNDSTYYSVLKDFDFVDKLGVNLSDDGNFELLDELQDERIREYDGDIDVVLMSELMKRQR